MPRSIVFMVYCPNYDTTTPDGLRSLQAHHFELLFDGRGNAFASSVQVAYYFNNRTTNRLNYLSITHFAVCLRDWCVPSQHRPVDNVKTRIMNQTVKGELYSGSLDCTIKTIRYGFAPHDSSGSSRTGFVACSHFSCVILAVNNRNEGFLGLYKGFTSQWMRIVRRKLSIKCVAMAKLSCLSADSCCRGHIPLLRLLSLSAFDTCLVSDLCD